MNILFYEDPLTDHRSLLWRAPHIGCDAPWMRALRDDGCDARMLVGLQLMHVARRAGLPQDALLEVDEGRILAALDEPHLDINYLFHRYFGRSDAEGSAMRDQAERHEKAMRAIVAQALGSFAPDVIITWVPVPHLRSLFPEALILHKETGLTSRAPFVPSYYLDPLGFHDRSALAAAASVVASARSAEVFPAYKAAMRRSLDASVDADAPQQRIAGFSRSLLVASQVSGTFFFDGSCSYRSQGHMLLDILRATPADTAVILSQHPDRPWLGAAEAASLGDYPNLIDARELGNVGGQQLLPYVDAVATVSSSVGFQSTLWDRPLVALGHSHLNRLTHFAGVGAIDAALEAVIDGADRAAWLAFHYSYLDAWVARPGWFASHLRDRLSYWRARGADGYFADAWADPEDITALALEQIEHMPWMPARGPVMRYRVDEAAMFASPWTAPVHGGGIMHRWLQGTEGAIRLPLDGDRDHEVTFSVAPLAGVTGQWLSLSVHNRQIAAMPLITDRATAVTAIIPADCVERPMTRLQLRALRADDAPGQEKPLSIVMDHVGIRRLEAPHIARTIAPRHSVLLPVLNGVSLLQETIPALLAFGGNDMELVVSDNCSDDGTYDYIQSIADHRIVRLKTDTRVNYAQNAENAYRHARGEWLSHIGDDDLVMPSRRAALEQVAADPEIELIFGNRLRYYWPTFVGELANSVDPVMLGHEAVMLDGPDAARRLINNSNIRHTGATVVRRSLVEKVRRLTGGAYMIPRIGEYATSRIAAGLARRVAFVNRPIVAIGRHTKSIGTSLFHDPAAGQAYGVSLEREIGSSHAGSGYNYLGFQAFSYEGALLASSLLGGREGGFPVDYRVWRARLWAELDGLIAQGRLMPEAVAAVRSQGDEAIAPLVAAQDPGTLASGTPQAIEAENWGLTERLHGSSVGVYSISQLVGWFEAVYADQLARPVRLRAAEHGLVSWIDM
ncbi:glycosyltransferase family 2 protein [Sphingomonas sp.]|uniref:glycosyltransferase family 2 protein n=1 Tax=Sphingomonas sp. TaxID=28214 RepID=UPI0025E93D9E|nr:glycosyltransferase family 2 protein [Sphingomonas sp.]